MSLGLIYQTLLAPSQHANVPRSHFHIKTFHVRAMQDNFMTLSGTVAIIWQLWLRHLYGCYGVYGAVTGCASQSFCKICPALDRCM